MTFTLLYAILMEKKPPIDFEKKSTPQQNNGNILFPGEKAISDTVVMPYGKLPWRHLK
jgi:hypothetical protein